MLILRIYQEFAAANDTFMIKEMLSYLKSVIIHICVRLEELVVSSGAL